MGRPRAPLVAVSIVVLTALLTACAQRPRSGDDAGYYLRFPDSISATTDDPNGGAVIDVQTDLPEDTFATVAYSERGTESSGYTCCPPVHDGILRVKVNDPSCYNEIGKPPSTGFDVTVTVVPDSAPLQSECLDPNGCSNPQPRSVRGVLGPNFERLTGDQVTTVQGMRALVASASYDWPDGVCDSHFASDTFMPQECPPNLGDISEDSTQAAANNVVGIFLQLRLCELYDDATDEFRATHLWPEFLEQTKSWVDALGPLVAPDGTSYVRAEVVQESAETFEGHGRELPVSFVAQYLYDGRKVAEAEFVEVGPREPNIVPKWEFSRLDLIET